MNEVITTVTAAIGLTKQLVEFSSITKDAHAKLVIADLQIQLAEIKMKLAELIDENTSLRASLKSATSSVKEVEFRDGLYFTPDNDGPFCTACYDSKGKLMRVTKLGEAFHDLAHWSCGVCKATY